MKRPTLDAHTQHLSPQFIARLNAIEKKQKIVLTKRIAHFTKKA